MFEQFMQMGAPAAFAIVGIAVSVGGVLVVMTIRAQVERSARRKYEIDRINAMSNAKLVEHKKHD